MIEKGISPRERANPVKSHIIAIFLVIFTEVLFFSGLISAFIVFKYRSLEWPPLNQPRLSIYMTGLNTIIFLISFVVFHIGFRKSFLLRLVKTIGLTSFLGTVFLIFQGYEWVSLLNYGLKMTKNVYGGFFYVLIGVHGVHVIVGMILLFYMFILSFLEYRKIGNILLDEDHKVYKGLGVAYIYWMFVVFLWPILYFLVYF